MIQTSDSYQTLGRSSRSAKSTRWTLCTAGFFTDTRQISTQEGAPRLCKACVSVCLCVSLRVSVCVCVCVCICVVCVCVSLRAHRRDPDLSRMARVRPGPARESPVYPTEQSREIALVGYCALLEEVSIDT